MLDGIIRWVMGMMFCCLFISILEEKITGMQYNVLSESKEVGLAAEINDREDQRHRQRIQRS